MALALLAIGAAPGVLAARGEGWERRAALPVGNGGFLSAALGGEIVIAGGTTWDGDTKKWLGQVWIYNPEHNAWREEGHLAAPLAYAVAGQDAAALWFAGGSSGTATDRALWRFQKGHSPQRVTSLERGMVYATGALIGSTLHVVGGTDDQAALERVGSTHFGINIKTGGITRLADYPEMGLTTGTAAAIGDRLFVFGGARWDADAKTVVNHATAYVYDVIRNQWDALPPLPYAGRGFAATALDARHILIAGGYRNDQVEFVADALLLDVETRRYAPTTPLPYPAMVSLVKSGEWLYCLGGEDRKRHRTDAVHRIRWRDLVSSAQ